MTTKQFGMIKALQWIYHHAEGILLAVLAVLLVVDVLLGILARYIQMEVVFATELGKYLFIWLSCIGISAAAKDNQHIRLSFLVEKLPIARSITWMVSQLLFLCMTLFMFYYGLKLAEMHFVMNKSAMGFNYPMVVFSMAIPVGFALCSIRLLADLFKLIKRPGQWKPWGSFQGLDQKTDL